MKKIILIIAAMLIIFGIVYVSGNKKAAPPVVTEENPATPGTSTTPVVINLPTPYIMGQTNWPPVVNESTAPYSCSLGTNSEMQKTVERTINSGTFCVTTFSEGAAGHTYSTYTYLTQTITGTKSTTFTLSYQNCGSYSGTQMTQCQAAQSSFNLDSEVASLF